MTQSAGEAREAKGAPGLRKDAPSVFSAQSMRTLLFFRRVHEPSSPPATAIAQEVAIANNRSVVILFVLSIFAWF